MGEAENRAVIDRLYERVWISEEHDFSVMDASFASDAVLEHPQSGERIRGAAKIRPYEEVSIFEFRDGLIVRHTSYFAQPFEPSERRARWVEQI